MLEFIFGTENERKRNHYKEKVEDLKEYKDSLDKLISGYNEYLDYLPFKFSDIYAENNELYGDAVNLFFEKSKKAENSINRCIGKLKTMRDEIGEKIDKANELYNYYSDKVSEE